MRMRRREIYPPSPYSSPPEGGEGKPPFPSGEHLIFLKANNL